MFPLLPAVLLVRLTMNSYRSAIHDILSSNPAVSTGKPTRDCRKMCLFITPDAMLSFHLFLLRLHQKTKPFQ